MDSFTQEGGALALASLTLNFLAPLRSRDEFDVEVWVEKITAARLVLGQRIMLKEPHTAPSPPNHNSDVTADETADEASLNLIPLP